MKVKLEFNWHDMWIGAYWKIKTIEYVFHDNNNNNNRHERHIWICVVPCLPIHIWWDISPPEGRRGVIA